MIFNDVVIVTIGKNDYRIHFWAMTNSQAVNRLKIPDPDEKSGQLWENKKLDIMVIKNIIPETVSRRKQYNEKKKERNRERSRQYY